MDKRKRNVLHGNYAQLKNSSEVTPLNICNIAMDNSVSPNGVYMNKDEIDCVIARNETDANHK